MKALTDEQFALLQRLPVDRPGEWVKGSTLFSANRLVRLNLAKCLKVGPKDVGAFYIRTATGTRLVANEAADVEATRVRRFLERSRRATIQAPEAAVLVRTVFGTGLRRGLGLDLAVSRLRAGGFTYTAPIATALQILADQEVAP